MNMKRIFCLSLLALTLLFHTNSVAAEETGAVTAPHQGAEWKQPDSAPLELCGTVAHKWIFVSHSSVEEAGDLYRWKEDNTRSPLLCSSKLNKMVNPDCPLEDMSGTIRNQIGFDCIFTKMHEQQEAANQAKAHTETIHAVLDAHDNTTTKQQTLTAKENQTNLPFAWSFLALSVAVSFMVTWALGLAPAFIARYAIYKEPLTKKAANWIAGISCFVFFFGFRVLNAAIEERGNGAVWIFIFFVSRWVMTRGDKNALSLKPKASMACKATSFLWKSPTVRVFVAAQIVWLVLLLFSNSLTFQYVFDFYYYDEGRFVALAFLPPIFILISLILGRWAWASFKKTDPTAQ